MTIKEQLAEKKAALVELEPQIKAQDEEAMTKGETLTAEIADLEAKCAQADKAEALLKSIETVDETNNDNSEEKKMSAEMTDRKSGASMHFKTYTDTVVSPTIAEVDKSIAPQPRRVAAEDFLSVATISGNAVTYFSQGAFETSAGIGTTAQNAKKPQGSTAFTGTTLALSKIAVWVKETDEIINDAANLFSFSFADYQDLSDKLRNSFGRV